MARAAFLERNASFPGNEIVLGELLGFGSGFAAGELDYAVQDFFAHLWNGFFAGDYGTGVDVDDVRHVLCERGIGGDFDYGRDGIPGGRSEAGGEEDEAGARAYLGGDALDVIAGGALEIKAGLGGVFGIVEDGGDGRSAAFFCGAGGLHGVGEQAIADVAGRGIHVEAGADGFGTGGIVAHELDEAVGDIFSGAAIDKFLLDAAEFGKFGEDGPAAESGKHVGSVTDGGIGGNAGETVGAATLQTHAKARKQCGLAHEFVGSDQPEESLLDGLGKHSEFRAALLLFEYEKWFGKIAIALSDLFAKDGDLGVLTSEAEDRGAGDVGMVKVAGDQAAEIVGVLAGSAAATFVH